MVQLASIEGGATPNKLREEVRRIQENLTIVIEAQVAMAAMTRAKYDALLAEGFTPQQALELCK